MKTEKTEYLSNQLNYAHFDWKFIFPIKFGTSEQILVFWISKMSQISGTATVKVVARLTFLDISVFFMKKYSLKSLSLPKK